MMSARGLLENPALFSGASTTPVECMAFFLRTSMMFGQPFQTTHRHCTCKRNVHPTAAWRAAFGDPAS